jgi:hypothetical protein
MTIKEIKKLIANTEAGIETLEANCIAGEHNIHSERLGFSKGYVSALWVVLHKLEKKNSLVKY